MFVTFFIIYYIIGTIILMNLLFNPNVKVQMQNKKTKKFREPTSTDLILIALFWIIVLPIAVLKSRERDMKENDR